MTHTHKKALHTHTQVLLSFSKIKLSQTFGVNFCHFPLEEDKSHILLPTCSIIPQSNFPAESTCILSLLCVSVCYTVLLNSLTSW